MFEKRKMQKSKLVKLKNCCQANKENVWPSFVGGNNSPSSIVWFEKMAWVYDLICSVSCKHVYIIYAFYVKKQWSQLLDLTAVVCTTWLRHIGHTRQHTKELTKRKCYFVERNLSITDIKWNYSSEKMKLRTCLSTGTGVIIWGVKIFRNIVLIGSCQSRKKK